MTKALTILAAVTLVAGSATARTWTLDQCVEYAIAHNIEVMQRINSADQGAVEVTAAKDAFLPQLSGYASQNFNFGRALTASNTYANRNTTSTSFGASLSLPLFQGLRAVRNLKYSRTSMKALLERVEESKDNVTLNVIGQYLQALYASELVEVARQTLGISERELLRRRQLLEAGKIAELDIYEAEAQVSRDRLSLVQAQGDSTIAVLDLAQLLNLPADEQIEPAPLPDGLPVLADPADVFANAMRTNHAVRADQLENEAAEQSVAVAKSGYIPTLSFQAGLGTNYYKTTGFENDPFGRQMRNNFAKSIGFSLSVPIFDAFSTRNNVKRARLRQQSLSLQLDDTRNRLYKSITQAHTQAVTALRQHEAASATVASTYAAFTAMQTKYDNGRANATEYEKAKSDYTTALAQQIQAKYEAILRARILQFYNK